MNPIHYFGIAPVFSVLLTTGVLFSSLESPGARCDYNATCRNAYSAVLGLRFSEARTLIRSGKATDPANLVPVALGNTIGFLTAVISEEERDYDRLMVGRASVEKSLETAPESDPLSGFLLGEAHLHWAVAELKFGHFFSAALDFRSAYTLFEENGRRFPGFLPNKMGMGAMHVMAGIVPDRYRWILEMAGFTGSVEGGKAEIRQVAEYAGDDPLVLLLRPQAAFYLAFIEINFGDKRKALNLIPLLNAGENKDGISPLMVYARATILLRNGKNEEAISVLQKRSQAKEVYPFRYLDFLEGSALLNKLDMKAERLLTAFSTGFRGKNYRHAACQKLAWINLLKGDPGAYGRIIGSMESLPEPETDEDRQALREMKSRIPPHVTLLKARLLSDGGYYRQATQELSTMGAPDKIGSRRNALEFQYRFGRIFHESGDLTRAIQHYRATIEAGRGEPYYFAAGAAYQLGLLYEGTGDFSRASDAFRLSLSIDNPEYKTSLRQKAKAGLERMKNKLAKT